MKTSKESPQQTYRITAILVGLLFIVGTVSGIMGGVLTATIRQGSNFPFNVSTGQPEWIAGTLLVLLMGLALALIPALLYPIFKKHNEVLALGYLVFRSTLETVGVLIMVTCMFLQLTISEFAVQTGPDSAQLQALGALVGAARDWTEMISGLVFSCGALMVYSLFFQTRLIPNWLSAWGMIGAVLYFIANLASLFGPLHSAASLDGGIGILMIPLFLQEMVFAAWLIAKGFHQQHLASLAETAIQRQAAQSWGK